LRGAWQNFDAEINPRIQEYGQMAFQAAPVLRDIAQTLVERVRSLAENVYNLMQRDKKTVHFSDYLEQSQS